jgi:putative oxidoreductase
MSNIASVLGAFKRRSEYGPVFIRIIIGSFIIWGVQDNILSSHRMEEFVTFLQQRGVPLPSLAARLSVYTQFVCGVLILAGAAIRLAAVPFIINFMAALVIAHRGDSFEGMFPPLVMLFSGISFLFGGAGRLSLDHWLERRRARGH